MISLNEMLMKRYRILDPSELVYSKLKPTVYYLINCGKAFYVPEKDSNGNIGIAVSLKQALEYITDKGVIASMPYLIAGKAKADKDNYLWKNWLLQNQSLQIFIQKLIL